MDIKILHTCNEPMLSNGNHWCHRLPGGRFGEVLAHPIYLLQAVLGDFQVTSVTKRKSGAYEWAPYDELRVCVDTPLASGETYISFNSARDAIFVDIFATRKVLRLDLINETFVVLKNGGKSRLSLGFDNLNQSYQLLKGTLRSTVEAIAPNHMTEHEVCIRSFVRSILDDEDPLITPDEGYSVVEPLENICQRIDEESP
jgi:predicted dehydrogenase